MPFNNMLLLNLHFFEPNDSILLLDLQRLLLSIKRYHYSSSGDQREDRVSDTGRR